MPQKNHHVLTRRDLLRLAGTTTGAVLLAACGPRQGTQSPTTGSEPPAAAPIEETGEPMYGGTLRFGINREPAGAFDPALATASTVYFSHWVYEPLVEIDEEYANAVPLLAERWEVGEDASEWLIYLRQGVMFHHEREFTADDVLFTFNRVLDPDFGSPGRVVFEPIQEVEKIDDYTVRFQLAQANADFPIQLAAYHVRIVPHDLTDEQIESEPRGTGPFRIDNYAHSDRTRFYRNESYWQEGRPYLDALEYIAIPEPTTLANALRASEVDIYHLVSPQIMQLLQDDPNIVPAVTAPIAKQQIFMHIDEPPFNDDRVRRAIKLIGDRTAMTEIAWPGGYSRPDDDNPVIPTSPFRIDTNMWQQDLEQVRRLLEEAGHGSGLELTLYAINDEPGVLEFSLAFADWAKQAGVTINVEGVKADRYYAEQWLSVPFGTVNWLPRTTIDEQLRICYHSEAKWNETHYRNADFDRMLDEAVAETDSEKRAELYAELQRKLVEEGGQIIPYHYPRMSAARRNVRGYKPHPANGLDPRNVWLEQAA